MVVPGNWNWRSPTQSMAFPQHHQLEQIETVRLSGRQGHPRLIDSLCHRVIGQKDSAIEPYDHQPFRQNIKCLTYSPWHRAGRIQILQNHAQEDTKCHEPATRRECQQFQQWILYKGIPLARIQRRKCYFICPHSPIPSCESGIGINSAVTFRPRSTGQTSACVGEETRTRLSL